MHARFPPNFDFGILKSESTKGEKKKKRQKDKKGRKMKTKRGDPKGYYRMNGRKGRRSHKSKGAYKWIIIALVVVLLLAVVLIKLLLTMNQTDEYVPGRRDNGNNNAIRNNVDRRENYGTKTEAQAFYDAKDEIPRDAERDDDDDDEDDNNKYFNNVNKKEQTNVYAKQGDTNKIDDDEKQTEKDNANDAIANNRYNAVNDANRDEDKDEQENEHEQKEDANPPKIFEEERRRIITYAAGDDDGNSNKPTSYSQTAFKVLFFLDDSPGISPAERKAVYANDEEKHVKNVKPIVEELVKEELRDSRFFYFYQMYKKFKEVFTPQEVQPFVWGTDFSDYNPGLTMVENIKRKYPQDPFDFVLTSSSFSSSALDGVKGNNTFPLAVMYEDCVIKERIPSQDPEDIFVCNHAGTGDLFFHSYANSMAYYVKYGYGSLLWHLPHSVDPTYFSPAKKHSERTTDILIVGSDWTFYPLRFKVLRMLDDGKLPGVVKRYINYPIATLASGTTTPDQRYSELESAYREYISELKNAKVVLVCSGKRNNANRLYVEAAAAGALVVGDIPDEREDDFRSWMVEVSPTSSIATLYHTLKWWLDNEPERSKRAENGMRHVIKRYGLKRSSADVVYAMQSYILGQRGAVFKHRFEEVDHFLPRNVLCAKSLVQIDKPQPKTNDKKIK